jgi:hypothetical protein
MKPRPSGMAIQQASLGPDVDRSQPYPPEGAGTVVRRLRAWPPPARCPAPSGPSAACGQSVAGSPPANAPAMNAALAAV